MTNKRSKAFWISTIFVALIFSLGFPHSSLILAQDPVDWQQSATGLGVEHSTESKTAGLGFVVQAENWPFLSLRGGVKNAGWQVVAGPIGIELGSIKIPGDGSATLTDETVDWAHNEMVFTSDAASQLQLQVSRLTPAILMQSASNTLRLFAGNVAGNLFDGSDVVPRPEGPSYPKYVAYLSGGNAQIQTLGSNEILLDSLESNWLLVWYGGNSHFVETKKPLTYTGFQGIGGLPQDHAYQADAPILLVFQNQPRAIKHSVEGGVEISFDATSDFITILPLFGRDHPGIDETENWAQGLPGEVLQRAQWWADRLCAFPTSVNETYAYDEWSDTATVTESISFLNVCSGGITFAPLPPTLAIARSALGITFSGTVIDGNLNTEFGPSHGIENTGTYSWHVSGLRRYVDTERLIVNTGQAPAELEQELASEVQKIIDAGHLAPWIVLGKIPVRTSHGDLYWGNPADTLYHLVEVVGAIDDVGLKNDLIDYIRSERTAYPPEDVFNLDPTEGKIRESFSYLGSDTLYYWDENGEPHLTREDAFLKDVPLSTFYALVRYYELTGEVLSTQTWQKARGTLDRDMREQDWATFYWFKGFEDRRVAVVNANRHFAGLAGFIKLSKVAQDTEAEALGRALLAKAAVLRLGMARYPRYLYEANLVELPQEPDWQVSYTAGRWRGYIFNYSWTGPYDDVRQVTMLDQFGVYLFDHSGFIEPGTGFRDYSKGPCSAHLTAFRDMTPELARFLTDFAKEDVEIYIAKVEALFPHWYVAFAEGMLGAEHNLNYPIDSFQTFMAKALIQGEAPQKLATYLDIPWLQEGDVFYLHKLAETIKAYRGFAWTDVLSLNARPGDQTVYLNWEVYTDLPPGLTWQIEYDGPTGDQPSPITGIISSTQAYTLTGLTNYTWYTATLTAISGSIALLSSDPVTVMPTDIFVYLPLILKAP